MAASLIDSEYFGGRLTTSEMQSIFSDDGRFASWLEAESALARAQARVEVIPRSAASAITASARLEVLNVNEMREHYARVGFPIVPLVHQLVKACDAESGRWVHWGAKTQDIVDTGLVLQMRDGLELLEKQLDKVIGQVEMLARKYRDTVMPGRTFQQQAAPITFGFKAAIWLDELQRHRDRLPQLRERALVCSLGGAVGTLATLGQQGLRVLKEFVRELNLGEPGISWHTSRDRWAEVVFWLVLVGTTLGKIGTEVAALMRTEVDEVREPYEPGRGSSSTMPQKRNPIACPILIAIAHRLRESIGSQLTAMIQEHERAVGAMPLEWMVIPEAFLLLSGSLHQAASILGDLVVDSKRMRENLELGNGLLMAEAVMMGLATSLGRHQAHELVTAAARRAGESQCTLRQTLIQDVQVMSHISEATLDALLDPANYTGVAGEMVDRVLGRDKPARFESSERLT